MTKDLASAYAEDRALPIGDNAMAQLKGLAQEQADLEAKIAELTAELAKATADHKDVSERKLPSLMETMGLDYMKFNTGLEVKVSEHIHTTIPKDKQTAGFGWLDANGHGKLIKREFVIKFPREEEAWANKFAADLAKRKKPVDLEMKKSIHPGTLKAFGKEQLSKGIELPEDGFSVHRNKVAELKIDLNK